MTAASSVFSSCVAQSVPSIQLLPSNCFYPTAAQAFNILYQLYFHLLPSVHSPEILVRACGQPRLWSHCTLQCTLIYSRGQILPFSNYAVHTILSVVNHSCTLTLYSPRLNLIFHYISWSHILETSWAEQSHTRDFLSG